MFKFLIIKYLTIINCKKEKYTTDIYVVCSLHLNVFLTLKNKKHKNMLNVSWLYLIFILYKICQLNLFSFIKGIKIQFIGT